MTKTYELPNEKMMMADIDEKHHTATVSVYALDNLVESVNRTGHWIPVSEYGYPNPEYEYKHFLTVDNKGEITIQEFLLSLDEEPQPYFTGMRNIIAWMPLPEPYTTESEGEE